MELHRFLSKVLGVFYSINKIKIPHKPQNSREPTRTAQQPPKQSDYVLNNNLIIL
jgi:hypothetical protein